MVAGNVDGAYKRKDKKGKRLHDRVAINLDKSVMQAIMKLAKKEKTTPANWCREIITSEVAAKLPNAFPEYTTFVQHKQAEPQPE